MFFDGPLNRKQLDENRVYYYEEVKSAIEKMLNTSFKPKYILRDYYSKYGFWKSAARLAQVINDVEEKDLYKYVFYTDFKGLLERWKEFEQ